MAYLVHFALGCWPFDCDVENCWGSFAAHWCARRRQRECFQFGEIPLDWQWGLWKYFLLDISLFSPTFSRGWKQNETTHTHTHYSMWLFWVCAFCYSGVYLNEDHVIIFIASFQSDFCSNHIKMLSWFYIGDISLIGFWMAVTLNEAG